MNTDYLGGQKDHEKNTLQYFHNAMKAGLKMYAKTLSRFNSSNLKLSLVKWQLAHFPLYPH